MKKIQYTILFLFFLCFIFFNIENAVAQVQTASTATLDTTQIQISNLNNNIKLINDLNSKTLNTIYWALGGLITIFIAIVGLNFFQNFLFNKKKIDNIADEIKNELSEKLFSNINVLKEEISTLMENMKKQNENCVNKANENFGKNIQAKIDAELSILKSKQEKLQTNFNDLNDKLNDIIREDYIRSAFEHKKENRMGYIFNLISALKLDIKKGWDFRINESLGYISKCLEEDCGNAQSFTELQIELDKLPAEYKTQKDSIESKMKL